MRDERGVYLVITSFIVLICVAVLIILFDGYQRQVKQEAMRVMSDEALSVAGEVTSNVAAYIAEEYRSARSDMDDEYGVYPGYAMCGGTHPDEYLDEVSSFKLLGNYERAYLMGNDLSSPATVIDLPRSSASDPCDSNPASFRSIVYRDGGVYKTVPMYGEQPQMPQLPEYCTSTSDECIAVLIRDYTVKLINQKRDIQEAEFWEDVLNNLEVKVDKPTDTNPLAYECDMQISSTRIPPAVRVEIKLEGEYKTLFHPRATASKRKISSSNYIDIPLCST